MDPGEFVRSYEDDSDDHQYVLYDMFEKLESLYTSAQKIKQRPQEQQLPSETLQEYVKNILVSVSPIECCRLITEAGHARVLRSVYRLLLNRGNDSKRYVCWLYGIANSGKSMFIRRLRKIFASDEVDWRGEYLPVNDTNKRHVRP